MEIEFLKLKVYQHKSIFFGNGYQKGNSGMFSNQNICQIFELNAHNSEKIQGIHVWYYLAIISVLSN